MTDSRKPTAGFWITVAVVVVLVYPLSFGPALWLSDHRLLPQGMVTALEFLYLPLGLAAENSKFCGKVVASYGHLWSDVQFGWEN